MTADVRSSVLVSRPVVLLPGRPLVVIGRYFALTCEIMKSSAAGLIGYYLVYAIGVRIRITRHEKRRRN
jgi:hypothetical protein